jgi:ferritin heavy chain
VEEDIYDKLLHLHKIAGETNDPNLSDFLEGTFLTEQVQALKTVSDHVTNMRRIGSTDLGVYLYDKQLSGKLNAADVLNNGGAPA